MNTYRLGFGRTILWLTLVMQTGLRAPAKCSTPAIRPIVPLFSTTIPDFNAHQTIWLLTTYTKYNCIRFKTQLAGPLMVHPKLHSNIINWMEKKNERKKKQNTNEIISQCFHFQCLILITISPNENIHGISLGKFIHWKITSRTQLDSSPMKTIFNSVSFKISHFSRDFSYWVTFQTLIYFAMKCKHSKTTRAIFTFAPLNIFFQNDFCCICATVCIWN